MSSRADPTRVRRILRFTGADLLILHEPGFRPLDHDEPMDLYEAIRQRHERDSIVVTSNRAREEWTSHFTDALMHHAYVMVMESKA